MIRELQPDLPVLFTHVPKTGGSAVTSGMALTVGRDRIAGISTASLEDRKAFLQDCRESGKRYVYGHFHLRDAEAVYDRANFIIALRHPVPRILSLYFMMLRNRNEFAAECAKDVNGAGFLRFYERFVTRRQQDNLICRYLCREANSSRAIEALQSKYAVAWDSDGASAAWEQLHRGLTGTEPKRSSLRKRNAAPVAQSSDDFASGARPKDYATFLPQSSMDMVADLNRHDIELIDWFNRRVGGTPGETGEARKPDSEQLEAVRGQD